MRPLFTLSALLILGSAAAQDKTGVAALPTPDGALLRWYLPNDTLPEKGFVLRVTDGPATRTVNVAAMQPYTVGLGIAQNDYDALKRIYGVPPKNDDERTHRSLLNLMVVSKPGYAQALGILTTLKGLTPGKHTVTVSALSSKGESKVGSAEFTTGPTPPVPQAGPPRVSGKAPLLKLSWGLPKPGPTNLVVAYNVYRSDNGGTFKRLNAQPIFPNMQEQAGSYQDEQANGLTRHTYQVTSVDLFGRESSPTEPVTWAPANPLAAPTVTGVVAIPGRVQLAWTAVQDKRVKGLVILRGTSPSNLSVLARLSPDATSYADQTAQPGSTYLYAVSAVADGGAEANSSLYKVTTVNTTPPRAPSGLRVTPGENSLTLNWTANAEPDIDGYMVYRYADQNADSAVRLNGDLIKTTTYVDPLPQGVQSTYSYVIVAVNTSNVPSARSLPGRGELTDKTPPPAPVLAGPVVTGGAVTLNWQQADVPDLAGFQIWRSTSGQKEEKLASVNATTRTYVDQGARPGVTYTYSLKSSDARQNTSGASNAVQATVPAAIDRSAAQGGQATLMPGQGVRLSWTVQPNTSYVAYRLMGGQPVQISSILSAGTYVDADGLASSVYRIRTVTSAGTLADFTADIPVKGPETPSDK